ncbi:hypothetical protein CW748_05255 [Alteromonadales bacterium alter-6D02]|nr:hypothetical protein CW748_05255 [Alteromonadales bacterium alter-6D02]
MKPVAPDNKHHLTQYIASPASHYKWWFIAGGLAVFCISFLMGQVLWTELKTQLMLISLIGLVLLTVGVAKHWEPRHSLAVSQKKLRYFHRYGQWSIEWHNIQRIFIPTFRHDLEQQELPYIAIKLKDMERIASSISPRLASRLVHEQRSLMVFAVQQQEITPEQAVLNLTPYKMTQGYEITGPIAAWLHQMKALDQAYGAHLFLPQSAFSQQCEDVMLALKSHL